MAILLFLIPISLLLLGVAIWAFVWAVRRGQFEDLDTASLDTLLEQMTGTALPVRALFDWMRGVQTTASGWQAQLGGINQGRLEATRHTPTPRATLRVIFEP